MSTITPPTCDLGLTRETVAAWHDGVLAAAEAERLAAHVATCPACRAHRADFEEAERLVREERVPEPDQRLWDSVRAAVPDRSSGRVFNWRMPPMVAGLGAVAAVLLLALGFALLFRTLGARPITTVAPTATATTARPSPTASSTPLPTSTPSPITQGTPLQWQAVALPPGMTGINREDALVASPADGATAYACFVAPNGAAFEAQVWVTHDTAQSWSRVATPATGALGSCSLVVDDAQPSVVVLGVGPQGAPPNQTDFYLTTNGGASWRALPQGFSISSLVTYEHASARIYAVTDQRQPDFSLLVRVQRSDDGGATWTPVDAGLRSQNVVPQALWLQPDTGALLVEAAFNSSSPSLYESDDGGMTWNMFAAMQGGAFIVATPLPSRPWRVCRISQPSPNANQINGLDCYLDGNPQERFSPRPLLITPGNPESNPSYFALLPDGSLLARALDSPQGTTYTLYRLASGATSWENVGHIPQFRVMDTVTTGNADLLWAEATFGMPLDPQGRVFVARVAG